jgi:hypothetical protein
MGGTAEGQDGDAADADVAPLIEIVPDGDLILDVTFEISKETLRAAKRAAKPRPGQKAAAAPIPKATTRTRYRVQLSVLKQNSKYFDNLLSDTRFAEARSIADRLRELSLRGVKPAEAGPADLPVVEIHEDDEATRSAAQDAVFADLLRILHRTQSTTPAKTVSMDYLAVLAVLADRFACTATAARYVSALKYKWPATQTRLSSSAARGGDSDDGQAALSKAAEETLRQKILVSWLLDQPLKMQVATRELIMYGSRRWRSAGLDEGEDADDGEATAAWWDLPDDLERELHYRRRCILSAIASVPRHFLALYTSRARQCKLGYDSSASCDSYQLGEMVKFLAGRDLLFFGDFSSSSFKTTSAPHRDFAATADIGAILAALRQCPAYQIDKHHTNCGLRTRLLPALDFVQAMLSSSAVAVARPAWSRDRDGASWCPLEDEEENESHGRRRGAGAEGGEEENDKVFRFTRGMATDQRLRHEGAALGATDRMARRLFTADRWDWTPEDKDETRGVEFGRWRPADILK